MQRICQINNLVIYKADYNTFVIKRLVDNKIIYKTNSLEDAKFRCRNCKTYTKERRGTGQKKVVQLDNFNLNKRKIEVNEQKNLVQLNDAYLKRYNTNEIILCHGSADIIKKPLYNFGEASNDYGTGFYCVYGKNKELAKEWSCSRYNVRNVGYVNFYKFDLSDLKILDLDKVDIIYWVTLVATCRKVAIDDKKLKLLQSRYLPDISGYDCIVGWRCDDTLSKIVNTFLSGNLTDVALREAIKLGLLQEQFVLKSEKAFEHIKFINSESVTNVAYYGTKFFERIGRSTAEVDKIRHRYRIYGKTIEDYLEECQS